jgi:hypothetical protein
LVLRPDVIIHAHALRLIQASDSDLNTVCKGFLLHAERACARGAETTFCASLAVSAIGMPFDLGRNGTITP